MELIFWRFQVSPYNSITIPPQCEREIIVRSVKETSEKNVRQAWQADVWFDSIFYVELLFSTLRRGGSFFVTYQAVV